MSKKKLFDVSRYKLGHQGLIELATIIEQSTPLVRKKIVKQLKEQDYDLLIRAMRKVVYFNEFPHLDESVFAEILANTPPKVLAYALHFESPEFRRLFIKLLGLRENRLYKDEIEKMGDPPHGFCIGAQTQILKIARKLESENKFAFELVDCPRFHRKKKRSA